MWVANQWKDYEILDCGDGEKLERWGKVILQRPDPQAIWPRTGSDARWQKADGIYHRSSKGGGEWENRGMPDAWTVSYGALSFHLRPFSFKHTGLFPEQAVNWDFMSSIVKERKEPVRVLNLFAYTGGATCALLSAGAEVTHVDASKGMVTAAKENAQLSGVAEKKVRWLVDDCMKFVERELRRGNRYDAVLLDPPSYGRGPKGEIWKIEEGIYPLLAACMRLLSEHPLFFILNMYTTGLQPGTLAYLLRTALAKSAPAHAKKVEIAADEIGLPVTASGSVLPCGGCGRVTFQT